MRQPLVIVEGFLLWAICPSCNLAYHVKAVKLLDIGGRQIGNSYALG